MSEAASEPPTRDPFAAYQCLAGRFDEAISPDGAPRAHTRRMLETLARLGEQRLVRAAERRETIFLQQGITFDSAGPDEGSGDRPFALDLIPRILTASEWNFISAGVAQRVKALNHFVSDVYGAREIVREGLVPWPLIASRPGFARPAHGIEPPNGVFCHVTGCDLVRDQAGEWRVLEDNVRVPSGISYVLENRIAMGRMLPELFGGYSVRPVANYPEFLFNALAAAAPSPRGRPTVVVWTPGPANSAYFEHAFLARQMGVELVEASDLVVHDGTCFMKTTDGLARVDSIYRRIAEEFIDPVEFRPDSLLGVPGLVNAARLGNVAIANALGTGIADDKAIYHYVPTMIRFYLGEEPLLANVDTYLLGDPEQLENVLGRLDQLVVKPTGESGGKGVFIGPSATEREMADVRAAIEADPANWIAQEVVWLSCAPTLTAAGTVAPRALDLRPFAVYGERIEIVPGGLTRVALGEGSMIVNSSQGGGSKDTWVLTEPDDDSLALAPGLTPQFEPPSLPALPQVPWATQSQHQQQQHARRVAAPPRAGIG